MKKLLVTIAILLTTIFVAVSSNTVLAADKTVVYFKGESCLSCVELEQSGILDDLAAEGVTVIIYDIEETDLSGYDLSMYNFDGDPSLNDLWIAYGRVYDVEEEMVTPTFFAGDQYYIGTDAIQDAFADGSLLTASNDPLLEVNVKNQEAFFNITGFLGFISVLGAGLLDGFNPCAIALLLLFVSLLSSNDNKKVLMLVSITYISALFVSYLLIGTFLLSALTKYAAQAAIINQIVSWFVLIFCIVLFSYNMYDFVVTKKEEYGKVKNQLPKWIQRFNKRIVKRFTDVINDPENKRGLISVLALTFILGITLSVTELICTGQIYAGIIVGIHEVGSAYAYVALVAYNFMFVLPLIAIAIFAIKGKGVMTASNWIREHLHIIKLLNALLFLGIGIFFLTRIIRGF